MKRFAILLTALAWAYTGYAQDCSPSRSSCSSSCNSNYTYVSCDRDDDNKRRRFDRMTFMWGAGAHFLPNRSTYAINGRASGGVDGAPVQRNWQSDAMIGIRYGMHGSRRANVLGVFGDLGMIASPALNRILGEQGIYQEASAVSSNEFRSLEAGFLFKEWFRLSAGIGNQRYFNNSSEQLQVDYYTATVGVYIPLGRRLVWTTTATALTGKDFQQMTIRPATGLAFRFNFMRI